jgi:hypothetical protein
MSGFRNIAELVNAFDAGKTWISTFRKAVAATATVTNQWYDFSYASGNPIANYYAAAPLEAALLEPEKGIIVPAMDTGKNQYIHRLTLQVAAASVTSTTTDDMQFMLLDYLLYYPFVDMDAAGEDQTMDNAQALTRYDDGVGVRMMMVAQSATVGGGRFTVTYIGSDDVQYTTPSLFCGAAQPSGALTHATGSTTGLSPFIPLDIGVRGVKRVVSVNFSVANGGLCAVALVKPLTQQMHDEASRRTTAGTLESFGTATEKEMVRLMPSIEIKNGAFLGIIGVGRNGSYASGVLTGTLETVWN